MIPGGHLLGPLIRLLVVAACVLLPWAPAALAAGSEGGGAGEAGEAAPGEVVSVFEEMTEAAESTIAGGFLKFFELAPKVRGVLTAHNHGDDATAVANGVGIVTEYGLALYLIEALGFAELFMAELQPTIEWASQIGHAVAGTVGVTKFSEFSGDVVEKTAHHTLASEPGAASEPEENGPVHPVRKPRPRPVD